MFADFRSTAISALILLSCCAFPSIRAQTLDYNNICLLIQNNELIAMENSCTQYYSCLNGVATLQTCPAGLYFSKDSQQCLTPQYSNCLTQGQQTCTSANIGSWVQAPGSCSNFYYCSASGPLIGSCPLGENFNPFSQSCVYATQYPCVNDGTGDNLGSGENSEETGVNLCNFMPNGVFFGSATSCSDWNLCTNNTMTTGTCPTGYYFNPNIGKCDFQANVNCAQVTNDPNLSNSPTIGGPCTTLNALKAASQCNAYYICDGSQYQLTFCSLGLYYDTVSQTCVNRMNARNNCDRCQGTTASFVNAYSNLNCQGYLYCQNGVEKGTGSCAPGSYFDELSGACVVGLNPNFGCCNPSFYNTGSSSAPSSVSPPPSASSSVSPPPNAPGTDSSSSSSSSSSTDSSSSSSTDSSSSTTESTTISTASTS